MRSSFSLSPGQAGDAPQGRDLLRSLPALSRSCHLVMDCAYEGNETRQLAFDLGFIPVVPPHPQRLDQWVLDKAIYRRRNEIERLFRRLKGFRPPSSAASRSSISMFIAFIYFALVIEALRLECPIDEWRPSSDPQL